MKPLLVSSGEPAGIGPDICLALAGYPLPVVVLGDLAVLKSRAQALRLDVDFVDYQFGMPLSSQPKQLAVHSIPCPASVVPGRLNPDAAGYVLDLLRCGARSCLAGLASALVTAPVHKGVINQSGIAFTGHTEFFADYTATKTVVMVLVSSEMRVALVTTHVPLRAVAAHLTQETLLAHLNILYSSLRSDFGISHPRIKVAGLNPHAGEQGYLGEEERTIIQPVIHRCQQFGMDIQGPYSADTLFLAAKDCDAFVAMYHDQGLPVIKYASFGQAVNVTCGLPFIRTSVDHGTALDLAGTGLAKPASLLAAVACAAEMAGIKRTCEKLQGRRADGEEMQS